MPARPETFPDYILGTAPDFNGGKEDELPTRRRRIESADQYQGAVAQPVQLDCLEARRKGLAGRIAEIADHALPIPGGQGAVPGSQTLHEILGKAEAFFQAVLKGVGTELERGKQHIGSRR
jgi:hypothetical protein